MTDDEWLTKIFCCIAVCEIVDISIDSDICV